MAKFAKADTLDTKENITNNLYRNLSVMKFTAQQIASFIDGEIVGNENAEIFTFAKIEEGVDSLLGLYEKVILKGDNRNNNKNNNNNNNQRKASYNQSKL